jgi:hypothetical protein
LDEVLEKLAG